VNSPTLAMTQRRKGTTKDLKCKAGRVRNPGSQCGLRSETDSRQRFHIKTKPTSRPKVPVAAILCKIIIIKADQTIDSSRWNQGGAEPLNNQRDDERTKSREKIETRKRQRNHPTKSQDGEKMRENSKSSTRYPPAPSNPMHRNHRIPYTNAYQRVSISAYTCHSAGLQYGQRKCDRPIRSGIFRRNRYSHTA
jgi:hypothetical protein